MEIKYLGHAAFLIKCGKVQVVIDPYDEGVGFSMSKVTADLLLISHHHHDHDAVKNIGGDPLVIDMAGEYEKDTVRVTGWQTFHDDSSGSERGKNVIFKIEYEGSSVLHLGDLGHSLSSDILEEIGNVTVLLIPVGGIYTIGAEEAVKLIRKIEPRFVIPMHFKTDAHSEGFADLTTVEAFFQKYGVANIAPLPALKVTASEEESETEVIYLEKSL